MFEKLDEAAADVLAASRHECIRSHSQEVLPEHLLLALTRDTHNIAARALATMNIDSDNLQPEVQKAAAAANKAESEAPDTLPALMPYESITYSAATKKVIERAHDFRRYFGRDRMAPEHILLGLIDSKHEPALQLLEELGANITFLRRQILNLIAKQDSGTSNTPSAKPTVILGISEIIWQHLEGLENLTRLSEAADIPIGKLPDRTEVVLMVFLAYLPEFLLTQVAYQRYLLEETLKLVTRRTGPVEKEVLATMVSSTAQNLRSEVRAIIDHLWTQEYRMLSHMPDEAEHEEIGSVIEDLWWTYSEEIALHEVFDEALDDYRRKHVLNLQKRKLEISQRLTKLKNRLEDTLKQCFLKRSVSA